MHKGRYTLGSHVPLSVRTTNSGGQPAAPTECPTVSVYDSSGARVETRLIPVRDTPAVTGLFAYRLRLGPAYSAGSYTVAYRWRSGDYHGIVTEAFEVTRGGDAEGAVIALHDYKRPHARHVVHQLDSGKLKRGRNPRI
jgi:hypothetical protein